MNHEGSPTCDCDTKYTGSNCAQCASGYQDNDGDGTCKENCSTASLNCNNGRCVDASGTARCSCDAGYTGSNCTQCASGYQDNDGNGTCRETCATSSINCNNGTCDDSSGRAVCDCETGHKGPNCTQCVSGYQDNDGDGTCKKSCALANLSCGSRASCSDQSGTAVCRCTVVGYGGARSGGTCSWQGGPQDPGFQTKASSSPWNTSNGATVDSSASGNNNSGAGTISAKVACQAPTIEQSFPMPKYSSAEPLELHFWSRTRNCRSGCPDAMFVGTNGGWHGRELEPHWTEYSICLGEGGYDGTRSLKIRTSSEYASCRRPRQNKGEVAIDQVSIRPASQSDCSPPGQFANGDFESGNANWTTDSGGSYGSVSIRNGAGVNGSRGAELTVQRCGEPSLERSISIPSQTASNAPALQLQAAVDSNLPLKLNIGGRYGGFSTKLRGDGSYQTHTVCLPPWLRGTSRTLEFSQSPGGLCGRDQFEYRLDNISLVQGARCVNGGARPLFGGFEHVRSPDLTSPWEVDSGSGSRARILDAPNQARTGRGVMRLEADSPCGGSVGRTRVTVPESTGSKGPALVFWYKTARLGPHDVSFSPVADSSKSSDRFERTIAGSQARVKGIKCLPPDRSGVTSNIRFEVSGGSGLCRKRISNGTLWVDDVRLTTTSKCPTQ